MTPVFTRTRLSFNVFALFLVFGTFLPFLPVWFEGRGLSAEDIGLIFALSLWAKIPVSLLMTSIADTTGQRKRLQVITALIVLIGILIMSRLEGFWPLLFAWTLVGTVLTTAVPLADSLAISVIKRMKADYGRIRLWGSISFMTMSIVGGWYLTDKDSEHVMYLLIFSAALMVIGAICLPNINEAPRSTRRPAAFELIKQPRFMLFIITIAFLQSSHAALYGFATLSWKDAGHASNVIGLLWAEGVIVEVVVFTFSAWVLRRLTIPQILLLSATAGLIRWSVIGTTAWLPALIMVQGLHGLTFAGTHLAAVTYIARTVPPDQTASAQGLYDGLAMGLIFGIAMTLSGSLFPELGRSTFYAMCVFSGLGGIGAMLMIRFIKS